MALFKPSIPDSPVFGVLAEYDSPGRLYHACEQVRDAGYTKWDAHSPFPGPRHRAGDGAPGLAPSVAGAGAGPRRRDQRDGDAVVDERRPTTSW